MPFLFSTGTRISDDSGVRVRIYGTTREGNSICCSATGYVPYIYAAAPKNYDTSKLTGYVEQMNAELKVVSYFMLVIQCFGV